MKLLVKAFPMYEPKGAKMTLLLHVNKSWSTQGNHLFNFCKAWVPNSPQGIQTSGLEKIS